MRVNNPLKPIQYFLLFCILGGGSAVVLPQKVDRFPGKSSCTDARTATFEIKCKDRYFFGESPGITISITNTGRKKRTVKEAEHQKFTIEMTGIFANGTGQERKRLDYDGSWDIPKAPTSPPAGESHIWEALRKREPKFVTLSPAEATTLDLDLSELFRSYLGVGKYKLSVKFDSGPKVVKEFEVYFDDRSVAFLSRYLRLDETFVRDCADRKLARVWCELSSDKEHGRTWALYRLAEQDKAKLITILEDLVISGNEDQRTFARGTLNRIKAGTL